MDRQVDHKPTIAASAEVQIDCIWKGPTRLGECPIWDERRGRLLLIDSDGKAIWEMGPDGEDPRSWHMPQVIGSIGLCEDGALIAALENGFAFIDISGTEAAVTRIGDPEPDLPTRLNDGKADRAGRYWCGSMSLDFKTPVASLYRLDPDLTWHRMDTGITVSNGIAFSLDNSSLYFSNSRLDESFRYDFDLATGRISNRRAFVDTSAYEGRIDGACVDTDGNYWGALFEGGAVACFSPSGKLVRLVRLPVSCPTMCAFGGPDLATLYVTSATFAMTPEQLENEPQAGGLFTIRGLNARGLPEPRFAAGGP